MILEDDIHGLKADADDLVPGIGQYLTGDTVLPACPPETLRELFAVLPVDQIDKVVASKNPYFSWFSACYALFLVGDYQFALNPFVDSEDTITAIEPTIEKQKKNFVQLHDGRRLTLSTFLSRNDKQKTSYLDRALKKLQPRPVSATRSRTTFAFPTGAQWKLMLETMRGDLPTYKERKKNVSHSSKIEYHETKVGEDTDETKKTGETKVEETTKAKRGEIIQTKTDSDEVRKLVITNLSKIAKGSDPGEAMFFKGLEKLLIMPKDGNGQPIRDYIEIPMQELIDDGIYSTIPGARSGFMEGFQVLSIYQITLLNMKGETSDIVVQPFIKPKIKNNIGYVQIDKDADWNALLKEYVHVPKYFYSLSPFARRLYAQIAFRSRQCYGEIKKNGFFDVSFRSLQSNLDLPNESKSRNPRRDIVEKIQAGLNEIEDAESKRANRKEDKQPAIYFELANMPTLEAHRDDYGVDAPVREYLEGKVRVYLSGDLAAPLIKLQEHKEKGIEKARRRKAKKESEKKTDESTATN